MHWTFYRKADTPKADVLSRVRRGVNRLINLIKIPIDDPSRPSTEAGLLCGDLNALKGFEEYTPKLAAIVSRRRVRNDDAQWLIELSQRLRDYKV